MENKAATLRTIATIVGVDASTVSRALSGRSSHRVKAETRARIREVAASLGYQPNPWAQSLRTKRSRTLGVIVPRLSDGVLAVIFEAVEDRARSEGYQAVTSSSRDSDDEEGRLVEVLLERRVEGLILASAILDDPVIEELAAREVPFVLMARGSGEHPVVRADDRLGGYLATKHLLSFGHSRVAYLAGRPNVSTTVLRGEGYRQAHEDAGVPLDPALTVTAGFSAEGGYTATSQVLSVRDRPTAIFAVNDAVAIGGMAAARDFGLRLPEDLAFIGYNDTELAGMLPTPLSSVSIPLAQMGSLAVQLLLQRLEGTPVEPVLLPPRLVARASSTHAR